MRRHRLISAICFGSVTETSRPKPHSRPRRVDPNFADAWYNLSDLFDQQGRVEAAIECLRMTVKILPDYVDAMFNIALLPQRTNQYAGAADFWPRYIAIDRHSEWAARARRSL
jgi:tetratricopeptide (TPR) repeat protein